MAQVYIK